MRLRLKRIRVAKVEGKDRFPETRDPDKRRARHAALRRRRAANKVAKQARKVNR